MSDLMRLSLYELKHDVWTPVMTTIRAIGRAPIVLWNAYRTDIRTALDRGWVETRNITIKPGVVETQARFTDRVERSQQ